jgi:serine/threonine protein phosphatase 1
MWNFLTRRADQEVPGPLRPAAGMRVYAFGDVHGRFDLFDAARRFVVSDIEQARPERPFALFLGDVIDRGPSSAAVVECLAQGDFPVPALTLRGNHEQMMLEAMGDDVALEGWLKNGGVETLMSYNVSLEDCRDLADVRRALLDAVPADHLRFLGSLPASAVSGDYFFCHAGIRPDVPLEEQVERDLLWIRRPFLESRRKHPKMIVHGHTPVQQPEFLPNRINIDTGAFATGNLTCLLLDGDDAMPVSIHADDS